MEHIELEPGLAVDPASVVAVWRVTGREDGGIFDITKVEMSTGHVITTRTIYEDVMARLHPVPPGVTPESVLAGWRCAVCVHEHRPTCTHRLLG